MSSHRPPPSGLVVLVLLAVIVIAGAYGLRHRRTVEEATMSVSPPMPAPAPVNAAPAVAQELLAPHFDVVRINPQGGTVFAGRASPEARVTILDGQTELVTIKADRRGEWVAVLDHPLAPGVHQLMLKAILPDGQSLTSEVPVLLSVPQGSKEQSLAVRINQDGSSDILQGEPVASEGLMIASITQTRQDRVVIAAHAPAQAKLRVYLDNVAQKDGHADEQGRVRVTLRTILAAGDHLIRLDQIGPDGKTVLARVEAHFTPAFTRPDSGMVTVVAGQSLWRIARQTLGSGLEYVEIYQRNREQIRDPNLIYPGQVLNLPPAK